MTSALILCANAIGAPELAADLETVGFPVVGSAEAGTLVQRTITTAPDVIVCYEQYPTDALFLSISALATTAPRPVVMFTNDADGEKIELAAKSGIHAYVVNGYGRNRLRSVIHVAQARFSNEERLRGELSDVTKRFSERKLVDRAKGILMRSHRISEEQAFVALRTAAMHTKQRVGQVSQQIIESARYGEAVNRAGQLRMFSQRIVKLYACVCADIRPAESRKALAECRENAAATLAALGRSLSKGAFGDLLDNVARPWLALRAVTKTPPAAARLREIDALAEALLQNAEQLVINLEIAGILQTLHVINVAGRQRMLSQRMAKEALLAALFTGADAAASRAALTVSRTSFMEALAYLHAIPLATGDIAARLQAAQRIWQAFDAALSKSDAGQREIAELSDALLELFDGLTEQYELGMQVLMK
jgi:AmiR/NasT family two-component response regulator